jgi:nitrogenase molybdenum-cofactor synthesis protein NifE
MCDPGTLIVDDSNPLELAKFCLEQDVDLFIGGVKERPIAYKLGIGFCDHNHERKEALAGYVGMLNFAREVHASVMSPIWQYTPRRAEKAERQRAEKLKTEGLEAEEPKPTEAAA